MQFFDRQLSQPPGVFAETSAQMERKAIVEYMRGASERRAQTSPPPRQFSLEHEEIILALNKLFRKKCAFCESKTAATSAHLFRPPEEAEPLARSEFAHLYYIWLTTDWQNVYLICDQCASSSRQQFPVSKSERGPLPTIEELIRFTDENYGIWREKHKDNRLLLDPCEDKTFTRHLSFSRGGEIHAFTKAGAQTIATFNLDRQKLIDARASAFEDYIALLQSELTREIEPNGFDFQSLEFGGGWYLLLRRALINAGRQLGQEFKFQPLQIANSIKRIWRTPDWHDALISALESVREREITRTVSRPVTKGKSRQLVAVNISNFKALESLELKIPPAIQGDNENKQDAESSALIVLGENAAGKSSILEAIALALSDEKARSTIKRVPSTFILDPLLMGSSDIKKPKRATVQLQFSDETTLRLIIGNRFTEEGTTEKLPPVFAYGAFRQFPTDSVSSTSKGHIATLFRSEALLANPESWLLSLKDDEFAMVIRALQKIFVVQGDFDVVKRDVANRRCLVVSRVGEGIHQREISTPLSLVSSGFRSVLAMICDVLAGFIKLQQANQRRSFAEIEAVLLIDEVEAHLHPRWKMQIMTALRTVLPRAIIIATTHDPLSLRGMHDQEVVVLNRVTRNVSEAPNDLQVVVETLTHLPNVENLTIEQLLTSDFFSMFSTDSPFAELHLARLGDLVAKRASGQELTPSEQSVFDELRKQVIDALPLGSSEVQRLVEEAVFTYLKQRRESDAASLNKLNEAARQEIIEALGKY